MLSGCDNQLHHMPDERSSGVIQLIVTLDVFPPRQCMRLYLTFPYQRSPVTFKVVFGGGLEFVVR